MSIGTYSCLFPNPKFNINVLQHLENDLMLEEKVALVFLLYDDVPVAQERLYLTLKADKENKTSQVLQMNLLHDWALKSGASWKEKLVEGLLILKAYSNLEKLDLDLDLMIQHFLPYCLQTSLFIHPIKKVLYSVCESLDSNDTKNLIEAVSKECPSLTIEKMDFEYFEYFLLKLIRNDYIQLGTFNSQNNGAPTWSRVVPSNIQKLVTVLQSLGFTEHCEDLMAVEKFLNKSANNDTKSPRLFKFDDKNIPITSCPSVPSSTKHEIIQDHSQHGNPLEGAINSLHVGVPPDEVDECYPITNSTPIGVFVIINQVKFVNSENPDLTKNLEERTGSDVDVKRLTDSWESLGFKVNTHTNLNYSDTLINIRRAAYEFLPEHSVFALCILSHGVKGSVYAADGNEIKIETIEELLFASEAPRLACKPKIIFIQACQGAENLAMIQHSNIRHDGPKMAGRTIRSCPDKSDMLVYWSTVPNYASYRDSISGTWFIQSLCDHIDKQTGHFDFEKLCKRVNNTVSKKTNECVKIGQMPEITTCFTKSLYLKKIQ